MHSPPWRPETKRDGQRFPVLLAREGDADVFAKHRSVARLVEILPHHLL
jgi:hypothetical protein